MTKLLYLEDFVKTECEAWVVSITQAEGRDVIVLDQTVFYPQGGGQPYDTGMIESAGGKFLVQEVRFADGDVRHIGEFEHGGFGVEEAVVCRVDQVRRMLHSRIHSAGHLVDKAVAELDLPWKPGKGYHFPNGPYDEYKGSLEGLDKEKVKTDLEALCNKYIAEGGRTEIIFMTREEMQKTCRYTPDFPAEKGEAARVVVHGGFAIPCGGTPVEDMHDIGGITIRKIRQEGENIRVGYDIKEIKLEEIADS
jgi:Ser-tRNA(Ala) deacylase AlaX